MLFAIFSRDIEGNQLSYADPKHLETKLRAYVFIKYGNILMTKSPTFSRHDL